MEEKNPKTLNEEKHPELKPSNWFIKAWKDPVGSNVIASLVIVIITALYGFFKSQLNNISIIDIIKTILLLKIELYQFLIIIIVAFLIFWLINLILKRKKIDKLDFLYKEPIGDLRFSELYNILIKHRVKTPPSLTSERNKEIDLLTCFVMYARKFGTGVKWNHPGDQGVFMYYTIGPILISYGLYERVSSSVNSDKLDQDKIVISEMGKKFYRFLSLNRMYNNIEYCEWD